MMKFHEYETQFWNNVNEAGKIYLYRLPCGSYWIDEKINFQPIHTIDTDNPERLIQDLRATYGETPSADATNEIRQLTAVEYSNDPVGIETTTCD